MSTILVDLDGTLADWGGAYNLLLDSYGDEAKNIRRHQQQQSFNLHDGCTPEESAIIAKVMDTPGFYAGLEPIPGAIEAVKQMEADGHDVFIVTSPWVTNPTCASDKIDWVVKHLGPQWGKRTVIASDKTIVRGDYLIDDKPDIEGLMPPKWEHILFDQPYNRHITSRQRISDWSEWRDATFPITSGGFSAPDAAGQCPIKGCWTYITGIPENTPNVPQKWYDDDGGSIESKIKEHNRMMHS